MNCKKIIALLMVLIMVFGATSCAGNVEPISYQKLAEKPLKPIIYSQSETTLAEDDSVLELLFNDGTGALTGEEFKLRVKIASNYVLPDSRSAIYYVVDFGDGTWSYMGPTVQNASFQIVMEMFHTYKKAGTYGVRAAAFDLSENNVIGWSKAKNIIVTGRDFETPNMIKRVSPISTKAQGEAYSADKIIDNNSATYFVSSADELSDDIDAHKYAGLMFDKSYSLDQIEIQIPVEADVFPSNISIEYTTDYGKSWTFLPKYYYLYDYEIGRYNPIMNFPNPKGATLSLKLDGICANGIRLASKLWPVYGLDSNKARKLYVSELRVYGTEEMLFDTSYEGSFDADINNMWTVYGSAKSEPRALSSIFGELPNHSPFRAGFPMIAVTEWMDWQAQKFAWLDYEDANQAMMDLIRETKYTGDFWSGVNGYIWGDPGQMKHFGVQSHYQYNALFIMGAANYILSGNFGKQYDFNGNVVDIFDIKNRDGQQLWNRLETAMNYQLVALKGNTGLLTINDPNNLGRVDSTSSSYFDAYNWDGYLSAYCNIFFYESLKSMAELYDYRALYYGDTSATDKAQKLRDLSVLTKQKFNRTFWDSVKGRYIGAISVDGVKHDFGLTYINLIAGAFGLIDEDKAKVMFEWIDGERIVVGDKSQGEDIYAFKTAPRSNTIDISSVGPPYYYWDHEGAIMPTPDGWGGWPNQQNGGTFFWVSHYDLLARTNYLGVDNSFKRFNEIVDEFHIDQLRRHSFYGEADKFDQGIIGEYPESGMVPLTFVNGYMGLRNMGNGLHIKPNLPSDMLYATVNDYRYGGRAYSITVDKNSTEPSVTIKNGKYYVRLPYANYRITADNKLILLNSEVKA